MTPLRQTHSGLKKAIPLVLFGLLASADVLVLAALPSAAQSTQQTASTAVQQPTILDSCSQPKIDTVSNVSEPLASPQVPATSLTTTPSAELTLAHDTPIKLKFKQVLSSKTAKQNQEITLEVAEDVVVQGKTVIAKGATAKGCVAEVERAKKMGHKGKLSIVLTEVQLASGESLPVRGTHSKVGGTAVARLALTWIVAPFFALMAGKEAKYSVGTEVTALVDGDRPLDPAQFSAATPQPKSISQAKP
jgi:hypothetical protein